MKTARSVALRIGYAPGKPYFPPIRFAPSDPRGLLQDSAGQEDHGSLPVEHANLVDIQLGESVDLGLSRA
jgi:hypothetical protein